VNECDIEIDSRYFTKNDENKLTMSKAFIDRNQQNSDSNQEETKQAKIDPVAQLKWINNQKVDSGFGVFNNLPAGGQGSQPTQMFAQDEEEEAVQAKAEDLSAGMQMKEEEELLQGKAEDEEELQMKGGPVKGSSGTQTGIPEDVRTKMESSFNTDFSDVKVHANSSKAPQIGALAYTQGQDIHFAPGQYNPGSSAGQQLLGHELAHVVQQRQGRVKPDAEQKKGMNINSDTSLEKEADEMGAKAAQGKMANIAGKGSGVQMQKEEGDPPGKTKKTYTPKVDYETLKKKMDVIAAESNRIYYAILTDIVEMLNSQDNTILGSIKKGTEEYNVVWQEIYKNVKLKISVMPYQTSPMLNAAPEYKVSDVDIIYKNLSLKEYRRQKLLDVGKEVGPMAYSWGSKLIKVIRGKGPGMFPKLLGKTASTVLGTGFLIVGFMLKSKEAGRGSSLTEQRKARLDMYRNATNNALEVYMPALFEALTN
jgi:hypothetical protein